MSHGKTAMMLMAALALPRAADALGLGEIHVESALNEPLAAQIDLVGVTDEDLSGITASIANRDTFQRFGVDRPAFLATTEFKIVRGAGGRAVLVLSSRDSFTEPLVDMLIDLRWHGGEAIRQYTLLMDPPGMSQVTRPAAAPSPAAAPGAAAKSDSPTMAAPVAARATSAARAHPSHPHLDAVPTTGSATIKVGPRATLRSVVARHLGVRGEAERTRMMIALFHANPNAFDGNINRLRRGSVLNVPSTADLAAISVIDARREFHSQMQAWRGAKPASAATPAVVSAEPAAVSPEPAAAAPVMAVTAASRDAEALDKRVQTLEKGLSELQDLLDRERDKLIRLQATLVHEQKADAATVAAPKHTSWSLIAWPAATVSALLIGCFAAFRLGRRRPEGSTPPNIAPLAGSAPLVSAHEPAASPTPIAASSAAEKPRVAAPAPTADAPPPAAAIHDLSKPDLAAPDPDTDAQFAAKLAALGVLEGIDVESLEASYVWESAQPASKESSDTETAKLASVDTAKLASVDTAKMAAVGAASNGEDPNAETMPVETVQLPMAHLSETQTSTVVKAPDDATVENTQLDYNLMDLDSTAHHVQMPSRLHENVGFKERRTSLVDALKLAIEREPNRRDLRMKLLETYFAAAASNRQGFLDLVRTLAEDRDESAGGDWNKIVQMGRQIAADSELFATEAAGENDKDLANCA